MKKLLILWLLVAPLAVEAQKTYKYVVLLKDKVGTTYSTQRPNEFLSSRAIDRRNKQSIQITTQDLPVSAAYVNRLSDFGKVRYTSKWLNAALVEMTCNCFNGLKALPFVKEIYGDTDIRGNTQATTLLPASQLRVAEQMNDLNDGLATQQNTQLAIDQMHADGFRGEGVWIGVLDSGFSNAQNLTVFTPLFTEKRVLATWDFVDHEKDVFDDHNHGTHVLSIMAANQDGQMIGAAPKASYALFRTEDVFSETKLEEFNWLVAAEKADSLGVDIIQSSLGYNLFDDASQNYTIADLNGDKTIAARAGDWAASKGIVVVVAAGNEGSKPWRHIITPADGDSVVAVAAVDAAGNLASFSSVGATVESGVIKPDVAAMGVQTAVATISNVISRGNGTSYAAPLIAGLVAGVRQAFPNVSANQLRTWLLQSGSIANSPNLEIGYGIPSYTRIKELANFENLLTNSTAEVVVLPNPVEASQQLRVFVLSPDLQSNYTWQIISTSGQILQEGAGKDRNLSINQEALAAGTYLLKIFNEKKIATLRILRKD